MPRIFAVCGTPALERIEGILRACGYRPTWERLREPGDYCVARTDAAPGWSDWMYEVEVLELPAHPVAEVLARHEALEKEGGPKS